MAKKAQYALLASLLISAFVLRVATAQEQTPGSKTAITLNGEDIPHEKFEYGALYLLEPHERCSPLSDDLLRERVIAKLLLHEWYLKELAQRGPAYSKKWLDALAMGKENIKDLKKHIETEQPEGLQLDQLRYQIAIYHFPTNFYDFSKLIKRDPEGLNALYKRLQAADHPLFTGTVAFKVKVTGANSIEESNKIAALFESGKDIEAVRKAINVTANPLRDGKRWIPAMPKNVDPLPDYNAEYWREKFPQWNSELEVGEVLGPEVRWLNPKMDSVGHLAFHYFQIVEKADTRDIQSGNGLSTESQIKAFRGTWIRRLFETTRYEQLQKQLREEAEVKVNGRVASANIEFSGCGDRTPESTLFENALRHRQ